MLACWQGRKWMNKEKHCFSVAGYLDNHCMLSVGRILFSCVLWEVGPPRGSCVPSEHPAWLSEHRIVGSQAQSSKGGLSYLRVTVSVSPFWGTPDGDRIAGRWHLFLGYLVGWAQSPGTSGCEVGQSWRLMTMAGLREKQGNLFLSRKTPVGSGDVWAPKRHIWFLSSLLKGLIWGEAEHEIGNPEGTFLYMKFINFPGPSIENPPQLDYSYIKTYYTHTNTSCFQQSSENTHPPAYF